MVPLSDFSLPSLPSIPNSPTTYLIGYLLFISGGNLTLRRVGKSYIERATSYKMKYTPKARANYLPTRIK